jgi:hypothetical protein
MILLVLVVLLFFLFFALPNWFNVNFFVRS